MSPPSPTEIAVALDPQIVACPKCNAQFTFYRSAAPHIDHCGFESYRLECVQCDTALAGIVDPSDNKILLSQAS